MTTPPKPAPLSEEEATIRRLRLLAETGCGQFNIVPDLLAVLRALDAAREECSQLQRMNMALQNIIGHYRNAFGDLPLYDYNENRWVKP